MIQKSSDNYTEIHHTKNKYFSLCKSLKKYHTLSTKEMHEQLRSQKYISQQTQIMRSTFPRTVSLYIYLYNLEGVVVSSDRVRPLLYTV